jgi:hypothetical protein
VRVPIDGLVSVLVDLRSGVRVFDDVLGEYDRVAPEA